MRGRLLGAATLAATGLIAVAPQALALRVESVRAGIPIRTPGAPCTNYAIGAKAQTKTGTTLVCKDVKGKKYWAIFPLKGK